MVVLLVFLTALVRHCRRHLSTLSFTLLVAPPISQPLSSEPADDGFGRHIAFVLIVARLAMLKISTVDTLSERRLILEGKLIQPWVAELTRICRIASESLEGRKLVIDLSNAVTISQEGENALFELMRGGASFSCGGVLTRHLLKQLAYQCHRGAGNRKHRMNESNGGARCNRKRTA